jgi:hypothetical protein
MQKDAQEGLAAGADRGLGRTFRRVGWLGFWAQIAVALVPIMVVATLFGAFRGFSLPGARLDVLGWFSLASLLILLFTILWSRRYMRIGREIEAGAAPDHAALTRTVWIGMGAGAVGVLLSLIVVLAEIAYLLIVFLEAPQGGAPVFQTVDGNGPAWISAIDMLKLLTLVLTAAAEIVVLLLALWLLFRLSAADPQAGRTQA